MQLKSKSTKGWNKLLLSRLDQACPMSRLVVIVTGAGQYRLKWEDGPVLASLPDDGMGPVPPTLAEWEHWKACRVLRERISHWRDTEGAWFETDPAATEAREIILEALAESWDHPQFILPHVLTGEET